jgi:hypothetical protein
VVITRHRTPFAEPVAGAADGVQDADTARHRFRRSQQHRELQLCVPLLTVEGQSYRQRQKPQTAKPVNPIPSD